MSCKWLTVRQMAEKLGVDPRTIRRYVKEGKLEGVMFPAEKRTLMRVCAKVPQSLKMLVPDGYDPKTNVEY